MKWGAKLAIASVALIIFPTQVMASNACSVKSPISMLAYVSAKYDGTASAEQYATRARELLEKAGLRASECSCDHLADLIAQFSEASENLDDAQFLFHLKKILPRFRQDAISCQSA